MVSPAYTPAGPARNSLSARVIAVAAVIAMLYFGRGFLITLITAMILASILDPAVQVLTRMRLPRPLASLIVCLVAAGLVALVGVGAYNQLAGLGDDLPAYGERIRSIVDNVSAHTEQWQGNLSKTLLPQRMQEQTPANDPNRNKKRRGAEPVAPANPVQEVRIRPEPGAFLPHLYEYLNSIYGVLVMASFVPFLVYFMLSWRDYIRQRLVQMSGDASGQSTFGRAWASIGHVARAYVVGNFLLGVLLSVLSALLFWILRLPYWLVLGTVSGFLSLVPYVGLPLALAPPMVAALIIYNGLTPYAVIVIGVGAMHLFALNVLYPKMVGARVHLNPLAVTVALMFWGTLWGGIGLVLAIPITAAFKAVCDNVASLAPYGRLLGDHE